MVNVATAALEWEHKRFCWRQTAQLTFGENVFCLRKRWRVWGRRCHGVYYSVIWPTDSYGQKLGEFFKIDLVNFWTKPKWFRGPGSKWGADMRNVSFTYLNGIHIQLTPRRTTVANHTIFIIIYNWLLLKKKKISKFWNIYFVSLLFLINYLGKKLSPSLSTIITLPPFWYIFSLLMFPE